MAAAQDRSVPEEAVTEAFDEDEPRPTIIVPRDQIGGVWANWARVKHAKYEFTIDFVRLDPFAPRGIAVARVSGSARFLVHLIDALTVVWHDWSREAMPPEVNEGDGEEPPEAS